MPHARSDGEFQDLKKKECLLPSALNGIPAISILARALTPSAGDKQSALMADASRPVPHIDNAMQMHTGK